MDEDLHNWIIKQSMPQVSEDSSQRGIPKMICAVVVSLV